MCKISLIAKEDLLIIKFKLGRILIFNSILFYLFIHKKKEKTQKN